MRSMKLTVFSRTPEFFSSIYRGFRLNRLTKAAPENASLMASILQHTKAHVLAFFDVFFFSCILQHYEKAP